MAISTVVALTTTNAKPLFSFCDKVVTGGTPDGDIIIFRVHGTQDGRFWRGDNILGPGIFKHTGEKIVLVANCYPVGRMAKALQDMKPAAIVWGEGENYGGVNRLIGVDLLFKWIVFWLRRNKNVKEALRWAKRRMWLTAFRKPDRDALDFKLWTG